MSIRKREWTTPKGAQKTAWVVDYVDGHGKRRLKTFVKKKEADQFAATAKVEVRDGVHVADSASVTVETAGNFWIASGESAGLERSTIDQRKSHLKFHITPLIGSILLSKISAPGIREFEDNMRRTGRSAAMVKKVITSLGSIFADANERGLAVRNPVRDIRGSRKGKERRSERRQKKKLEIGVDIPAREEVKNLIANLEGHWRPFFITVIFTGMRSSEIRGLRWQDVDFERKHVSIRQRVDKYRQSGPPKSEAGARTIPIPPLVVSALKEQKLRQASDMDFVFANPDGESRSHQNVINKGLIPAMKRAGVLSLDGGAKYTGLHALRHFYASWLINRKEDGGIGLPVKMVQERLGHSSIIMTMDVYGHLFPQNDDGNELEDAANALLK